MLRFVISVFLCVFTIATPAGAQIPSVVFPNSAGLMGTDGKIDLGNAFFRNLGTNGRTCASCHQFTDGMSVTPDHIRLRFLLTGGTDPIFRPVDGSGCDTLDVSTVAARQKAYSLLLNKGLIRIAIDVPANAEFTVVAVDNPYGCSSTSKLSMYRRPLPATNLRFLSTVMWDGRESLPGNTLQQNLKHQANDATTGHAQGAALTDELEQQMVDFEMGLHTAQWFDFGAGLLGLAGAKGGPGPLSVQPFFLGINDPLGQNPATPFNPSAFDLFAPWLALTSRADAQRLSIARGEQIFNTQQIAITGVGGLNDVLGLPSISGTCTTCHNSPNVGDHSVPLPIDIGVSDASRRTADMPLFTLQKKVGGQMIQTMDPGRSLVTGKWADIGKTKGPVLRGLPARAPYFHNGSAATLLDVVNFYDSRFLLHLTAGEKNDLVNFLSVL